MSSLFNFAGLTLFFLSLAVLLGISSRNPPADESAANNETEKKVAATKKQTVKKIAPKKLSGIDDATGFTIDPQGHWETVRNNCIACHSAKIVTQSKMSRETWLETIRWMQKTQGLWELQSEDIILDYLAEYYGVEQHSAKIRKPIYL